MITNRKARAKYQVLETFSAGISLSGPEVKSLRLGQASLGEAHVRLTDTGAILVNAHISPYRFARTDEVDPTRSRVLLLTKHELSYLRSKVDSGGLALVPLAILLHHNRFKVEIGLVRGKKIYEKREDIKKRDLAREVSRAHKLKMR